MVVSVEEDRCALKDDAKEDEVHVYGVTLEFMSVTPKQKPEGRKEGRGDAPINGLHFLNVSPTYMAQSPTNIQ